MRKEVKDQQDPGGSSDGSSEPETPPPGASWLPPGRHGLPREVVVRSQRERMFEAMAHAVADRGYEKTSVADVLALARVSRKTFYQQFADKQACFLAAYEEIFGVIYREVTKAYESAESWPERISAALETLLDRLAADPHYARAGVVEVLAAGQPALERRDLSLAALQGFFDPGRDEVPNHGAPPIVVEATVGGIYDVIYRRIVTEGAESLPALHADLTYLALVPFIGADAGKAASRGA